MVGELVLRFVLGGAIVSAFAIVGSGLRPQSFAGIFSAAPSVALATLGIAYATHGAVYVASEARSMAAGAIALAIYCATVRQVAKRPHLNVAGGAALLSFEWLAIALGLWAVALR